MAARYQWFFGPYAVQRRAGLGRPPNTLVNPGVIARRDSRHRHAHAALPIMRATSTTTAGQMVADNREQPGQLQVALPDNNSAQTPGPWCGILVDIGPALGAQGSFRQPVAPTVSGASKVTRVAR